MFAASLWKRPEGARLLRVCIESILTGRALEGKIDRFAQFGMLDAAVVIFPDIQGLSDRLGEAIRRAGLTMG